MTSQLPNQATTRPGFADSNRMVARTRSFVTVPPAVVLLGGAVLSVLELRVGLFAAAVVLGWTQLVGI